jgi:broad specificity phosphatase PhoE
MSATRKLFIMRHAESLEDIDQTSYERIADEDMPLTDFGKEQAARFGQQFANEIGRSENLRVFLSPSKPVLEMAQLVVSGVPKHVRRSLVTDSLISKQDWGNVTIHNRAEIEKERYRIGVLRYRFPGGESGAECFSVSISSSSLKSWDKRYPKELQRISLLSLMASSCVFYSSRCLGGQRNI